MTAIEHRFGPYGGQYVPETLMRADDIEAATRVLSGNDREP
jgi:tryptophan synthase beta subunit